MPESDAEEPLPRTELRVTEKQFKETAELMRLYMQDSSGASSFQEFCERRKAQGANARPVDGAVKSTDKSSIPDAFKNALNNAQKSFNGLPAFPGMGIPIPGAPLNPQMFPMMAPPHVRIPCLILL